MRSISSSAWQPDNLPDVSTTIQKSRKVHFIHTESETSVHDSVLVFTTSPVRKPHTASRSWTFATTRQQRNTLSSQWHSFNQRKSLKEKDISKNTNWHNYPRHSATIKEEIKPNNPRPQLRGLLFLDRTNLLRQGPSLTPMFRRLCTKRGEGGIPPKRISKRPPAKISAR